MEETAQAKQIHKMTWKAIHFKNIIKSKGYFWSFQLCSPHAIDSINKHQKSKTCESAAELLDSGSLLYAILP